MKKYFYLLFIFIFFIPTMVLADVAGPSILGYDAVIINPNGAKDSYEDKVIPYNTKIRVYNEYEGVALTCIISEIDADGGCHNYSVSTKDIMPSKEEIDPSKDKGISGGSFVSTYNGKIIVFNKNGLKLKKGPADAYGTYDKVISYKTSLKVTYAISSSSESGGYYPWYYVNDGEYKGWISYYETGHVDDEMILFTDTKMVDDNNKVIQTIPAETVLKEAYYIPSLYKYYLSYNGKNGYVGVKNTDTWKYLYEFNYGVKVNQDVYALKDVSIVNGKGKNVGTIKKENTAKVLYAEYFDKFDEILPVCYGECFYYVQSGNTKGFIKTDDIFAIDKDNGKIISKKGLQIVNDAKLYNYENDYFSNPAESAVSVIGSVPNGTKVISYFNFEKNDDSKTSNWYLVNYNGIVGYVSTKDAKVIPLSEVNVKNDETETNNQETNKDDNTTQVTDDNNNTTQIVDDNQQNIPVYQNDDKKVDIKKKTNDTIIYAIVGAIVGCLISVVTILLINKNKKSTLVSKEQTENNDDNKKKELKKED